jgi:N-glycosylase/DNA lyase
MKNESEFDKTRITELKELYKPIKSRIILRLEEFRTLWAEGSDDVLFRELTFCLLTPQSRAKICWKAVQRLEGKCLLNVGEYRDVMAELSGVRFKQKKAEYICQAQRMFANGQLRSTIAGFSNPHSARKWLVSNVRGLGYKEASHFLRNIGLGEDLAILDRHVLKNLTLLGVIESVPSSIGGRAYMDVEQKMRGFSEEIEIPMAHLDLLLWYKEVGEVFK